MNSTNRMAALATLMASVALMAGCETVRSVTGQSPSPAPATAAAPGSAKIPAPAPAPAATPATAGNTVHVKGLGDWEGDIIGKPAPGSKFPQVKIGMSIKEVTDLIGPPTDQGAYVTGKAFIPFFFGSDRYRHELAYKGQGRLVFAGGSVGDYTSGHLIEVTNNAAETGYR